MKHLVKELETRRDTIVQSLDMYLKDQVVYSIPQGGIHLWCHVLKEYNETQLLEESIKRGVIYVPGSTMGSKRGLSALLTQGKMSIQSMKGLKGLLKLLIASRNFVNYRQVDD